MGLDTQIKLSMKQLQLKRTRDIGVSRWSQQQDYAGLIEDWFVGNCFVGTNIYCLCQGPDTFGFPSVQHARKLFLQTFARRCTTLVPKTSLPEISWQDSCHFKCLEQAAGIGIVRTSRHCKGVWLEQQSAPMQCWRHCCTSTVTFSYFFIFFDSVVNLAGAQITPSISAYLTWRYD